MARESPAGLLLAERKRPARRPDPPERPDGLQPATRFVPVPDLELRPVDTRSPASLRLLSVSTLLHAGLAVALLVGPLLTHDGLPAPASGVRVFFSEPLAIPPPPAPAAAVAPGRTLPKPAPPPEKAILTPPVEIPEAIVPEAAADLVAPSGEAGGVVGGVPGGAVGGVVEALPEVKAEPQVVQVGGAVREPTKVKHVNPVYPDVAARAMVQGNVIVELHVGTDGRVNDAQIVKGIPLLNDAALAAVRQWVYTPPLVDGVPVRLVMTVTVRFKLT
jgi:protein TonB